MGKSRPKRLSRPRRRPSIRAVILSLLLIAVLTPMAGLFFFRVFENQLIRKTEAELLAQSTALAAIFRQEAEPLSPALFGAHTPADVQEGYEVAFSPYGTSLDLARDPILPPRPDIRAAGPSDEAFLAIGARLEPVIEETKRRTLAGIQLLDPNGVVLTGREAGHSLAHVEEIAKALDGHLTRRLRTRLRERPPPLIYYATKGASLRVFTAFPIILDGQVAGVVYASRTPAHVLQVAWAERRSLLLAAALTLGAVLLAGLIAARAVTGPILALTRRTRAIAAGKREAMAPLHRSGTQEIAELSETFLRTSLKLHDRSANVAAFAAHVSHELKSPLTAIQGAAELIRDSEAEMTPEMRLSFITNIITDADRMTRLVRRLLEHARAETVSTDGACRLSEADITASLSITHHGDAEIAMPPETLSAILNNLAENAAHHGARALEISTTSNATRATVRVADDGAGISPANQSRLFEPFFTTRRATGGTGMGLSIVRALVEAHDGIITFEPTEAGAAFVLDLPLTERHPEGG